MKGISFTPINAVTLADGALSDANTTEVDFFSHALDVEFILTGKIVPNTTASGSNTWLALNWYWSDEQITTPGTNVPLYLPLRKHTTGPIALSNATLANNGLRYVRFKPAITLQALTTTASTTTATITFPPNYFPPLNVGDLITVFGGTVGGNGNLMQGTYPVAAVTQTSGANGQLVTTATYTITSSTGTLVGATVVVERSIRRGTNDLTLGNGDFFLRPAARFLYLSVDRSALTTNATTTLSVNVVRLPQVSNYL